jgi:hypothetical protein
MKNGHLSILLQQQPPTSLHLPHLLLIGMFLTKFSIPLSKSFPFAQISKHVKGHQDHDMDYKYLPLLAQLNVDANHATGDFQDQHGCHCPHVLLFPHNGAQLQITDATITYNYKSYIRNAAYGPPLLNYIQQRNQWTPAIMQTIDWDAHGMAIHRHFHYLYSPDQAYP